MTINQLREQLSDLKKKEAIAQTREQLLNEDRDKLLSEITGLYGLVKALEIIPAGSLTPDNLSNVIDNLSSYIDFEIAKSEVPKELL